MKNNQALIENFLEAKFGEEGLSENTILAYSRDLEQICKKVGKSLVDVSQSDLEQYFIYLKNSGHSKSTTARRLSTIKQFYKFHVEKGFLSTDPTAQLTGPRSSKPLPKLSQLVKWRPYCKLQKIMEKLNMSGLEIDV